MHRAKHRAAGRASADVLATTLIERFAVDALAESTHHAVAVPAPRSAVALAERPDGPVELPDEGDSGDAALFGIALYGGGTPTGPMLAVTDEVPVREAAPLFRDTAEDDDRSPFGAARHAARCPAPARSDVKRPQPVGAALTVTVLGAAAAVTAAVAPPVGIESTGELVPVQRTAPDPGPDTLTTSAVAASAPDQPTMQPTMQVDALVNDVTAQMTAVEKPYRTVANTTSTSAAAMRKTAMSVALSKVGKPYRWGASGPNAFDCSGLVKWSFAQAGRSMPRTSRAQAGAGTSVSRANLQPGDLVFFYKPISHVGIYIGNGKIVHASRKGQPVKVSDMSRMKFTKAVRPS